MRTPVGRVLTPGPGISDARIGGDPLVAPAMPRVCPHRLPVSVLSKAPRTMFQSFWLRKGDWNKLRGDRFDTMGRSRPRSQAIIRHGAAPSLPSCPIAAPRPPGPRTCSKVCLVGGVRQRLDDRPRTAPREGGSSCRGLTPFRDKDLNRGCPGDCGACPRRRAGRLAERSLPPRRSHAT